MNKLHRDDIIETYRNIEAIIRRLQAVGGDVGERKPMSSMLLNGLWARLDVLKSQIDLYTKHYGEEQ